LGLDERTVREWQTGAGRHCQQVQAQLVEQPRDLSQVQADEIWVKLQGVKVWMALALQVGTRLPPALRLPAGQTTGWLGGVTPAPTAGCGVSAQRDRHLITALIQKVRACAVRRPLLICVDGLATYVNAVRQVFRDPLPRQGQTGRRRLRPWRGLYLAQVVKQYAKRHVIGVTRRIVQGKRAAIQRLIGLTQGGGGINTAYIERLNATFRARLHRLVRRGRSLGRQIPTLQQGMYLVGVVYNFCTFHDSLRLRRRGRPDRTGHRWHLRTPGDGRRLKRSSLERLRVADVSRPATALDTT
jgi:hypothetical protein